MTVSALKAARVLSQLLVPFPVTQQSVSGGGGGGVIKRISVITSRPFLLSYDRIPKLPGLMPEELHHGRNWIQGPVFTICSSFIILVMDENS